MTERRFKQDVGLSNQGSTKEVRYAAETFTPVIGEDVAYQLSGGQLERISVKKVCKGENLIGPLNLNKAIKVLNTEVLFCGQVLRKMALPAEINRLIGAVSSWPTIPRDPWFAYGRRADSVPVIRPNCDELDRLDNFMDWLLWLVTIERTVIFAKACGFGYRKISRCIVRECSHDTVRKHYFNGLEHILVRMASETVYRKRI